MSRKNASCLLVAGFLLSLVFFLPGCSKSKQALIVGTWKPAIGMNLQMVFNADGTYSFASFNGKYRIDGDKLILTSPDMMNAKTVEETMTILTLDEKNLTIESKDGKQDFVRVK